LRAGEKGRKNDAMLSTRRIALLNLLPCLCLATLVPVFSAQSTKQTVSDETQDLFQRQIGWDENQPSEKNPNGLSFQFFNTGDTTSSGKRLMHYRAYVFGAPESKKYTLTVWKIGADPQIVFRDVYVNAKGLLMVHKPSPEQENSDFVGDDELHLAVQAAQAEPVRYMLTSSDKELIVYGTVVPFPIEKTDGACQLEVRIALPDAIAVLIYVDGLPANAVIPFQLISAGETETRKFNVNAQGHAVMNEYPAVKGRESGSLRVTLATTDCSVAVDIPWGPGSYHPL
jgi:hypothetical protein